MDAGVVVVGLGFALAAWDVGRRVAISNDRFTKVEERCARLAALVNGHVDSTEERFKKLEDADKNLSNKVTSAAQRRNAWGR